MRRKLLVIKLVVLLTVLLSIQAYAYKIASVKVQGNFFVPEQQILSILAIRPEMSTDPIELLKV